MIQARTLTTKQPPGRGTDSLRTYYKANVPLGNRFSTCRVGPPSAAGLTPSRLSVGTLTRGWGESRALQSDPIAVRLAASTPRSQSPAARAAVPGSRLQAPGSRECKG